MYGLIIITNKIEFSNNIKDYFQSLSPINFNNIKLFTYGVDVSDFKSINQDIVNVINLHEKVEYFFMISDFGTSSNISKEINVINEKIHWCKGSIIENGYLLYKLVNGGAPIESIMLSINEN
ncbi:MAG: hypothetical protein KFW07_03225 [Mycoplasmataceae bacterium]|nr:hypothetical protein [Mycoplasmataceae bacterium]